MNNYMPDRGDYDYLHWETAYGEPEPDEYDDPFLDDKIKANLANLENDIKNRVEIKINLEAQKRYQKAARDNLRKILKGMGFDYLNE